MIHGTIKCRGYTITGSLTLPYPSDFHLGTIEQLLCHSTVNSIVELNRGYDLFCNNQSRTFNNRSYHFVDVCQESRECFSAYRIGDGDKNCPDDRDEHWPALVLGTCSGVKHHRFRCSAEKVTCLPVSQLSSLSSDCQNLPVGSSLCKAVFLPQLSCASDEEAIIYLSNTFASRNTKLYAANSIKRIFAEWYAERPFLNVCNVTSEFSCYRIGRLVPSAINCASVWRR